MCRIEERIYVSTDGNRRTFEESFPCHKSKHGRLCGNIDRRRSEYHPKPVVNRENSSSPASYDPPTPTGTGTYLVQQRRPSTIQRRPSTREGARPLKPEIIIEFGSRKDKSKKYPAISVKSYKRTSLGTGSVGSNDAAIESPGSDASFTVRTGLADTPVPLNPYQQPSAYTTRPVVPHRHTSSTSSFTTSSQPPSLYATSEPESPTGPRAPRYPRTIVHNPPSFSSPPSPPPSRPIAIPVSSNTYRVSIASPQDATPRNNIGADGLFPLDYAEFHANSGSSHASSGRAAPERSVAPEITDRDAERARLRKLNAEAERHRLQEADRLMAQKIALEEAQSRAQEEAKQVRFELDRAESREKERNARKLAENEKRRAEDRAEAKLREERAAREDKKEKERLKDKQPKDEGKRERGRDTRPPTRDATTTKRHHSRKPSISRADAQARILLLAETEAQMAREREATDQREREERAAILRQQQQTTQYYDPRGGERYPVVNDGPTVGRRNSVSGRRPSLSAPAPPIGIGRTTSQRVSIIQPAPPANLPPLTTNFQNPYSARGPAAQRPNPPTQLFSPTPSAQTYTRPPSARHRSYAQDNPFAQPPTRTSQENPFALPSTRSSQENPFAPTTAPPPPVMPPHDPWDTRNVREALPQTADLAVRHRGEPDRRQHDRARQATKNMNKIVGYENEYETTDEQNEADKISGHGPRLGVAKKEKKEKRRV